MKCGYLGREGSYSYLALREAFPGLIPVSCDTFAEIIESVDTGILERGILPVENSTEGAVTAVMDSLLNLNAASLQGETIYTVRHYLASTDGRIAHVRFAYSHPQAIEQCRHFFRVHYPAIRLVPCESTSKACQLAKDEGMGAAAIASRWAADYHGLKPICGDIQDNQFNQTRFVLLGIGSPTSTGCDKTAIAFSFHHDTAGSLHQILEIFAGHEINLTRIESRPAKMELGKYVFFIDFEGHQQDAHVVAAMEKIQLMTRRFHVFGSFPQAAKIGENSKISDPERDPRKD